MKKLSHSLFISAVVMLAPAFAGAQTVAWPVASQDVVWNSPSTDSKGSMPLGNGDIGLNVWVEPSGDLLLLIGKTDSFDEFNRLLKIGCLRVRTSPVLFQPGMTFSQTLHLADGAIEIQSGNTYVRVWVDANHPVAQVDLKSAAPVSVQVLADNWRTQSLDLSKQDPGLGSFWGNWPDKKRVNADTVLPKKSNQIGWCHHNVESQWQRNLELTGLGTEVAMGKDPILNRSFGALVRAAGTDAVSDIELKTAVPTYEFTLRILCTTRFADLIQDWERSANLLLDEVVKLADVERFTAHQVWWNAFWNRSWIQINGDYGSTLNSGETVSHAYTLQRFVTACSGRGGLPIKFNGTIFTVEGYSPDYRRWGSGYWWQNTRLPYWSMLYAGDYEMMLPLFDMYLKALPLREAASKTYYNHSGGFFPEVMYFWGNYMDDPYGFDRTGLNDSFHKHPSIRYYWQGGLELVAMMMDYYDTTQDTTFRDQTLLPMARSIITFYDQHWPRVNSKILFEPAQALETYEISKNPMPDVAGLHFLLPRLLELQADETTKAAWSKTLADLPPLPIGTRFDFTSAEQNALPLPIVEGKKRLLATQKAYGKNNFESPELYAVFPYRLFTCLSEKDDHALALNAFEVRANKENYGWFQDDIWAAMLGLAEEARTLVSGRAAQTAVGYRFPAFFGPNYDWTPDQDHGGVLMIALQRMLMQCDGDKIAVLPSWPKDWDVSFKLNAPRRTTIEVVYRNGKIEKLEAFPRERLKDIILPSGICKALAVGTSGVSSVR